jgi:MFS family permease
MADRLLQAAAGRAVYGGGSVGLRGVEDVFEALRNRHFRVLWVGSLSAFVGFFTSTVVQSVVAFELTGKNTAAGLVVSGRGLAQLLLAPIGGALADRVSKRAILLSTQSVSALVFFGLAWLMWAGQMQISYLTAGGFLVGMTFAFLGPTRSAYVVELVEPERRPNAVALNQVALNLSRVAGPALAGLLLETRALGATAAFVVMGALYGAAVLTQYMLPPAQQSALAGRGSLLGDMADGLRYVRGNPRLRALLTMFVLTVMLGFPYVTVLPGLVKNQLHLQTGVVSRLFLVSAAGGLLASLFGARLSGSPHAVSVYRASGLAFGLSLSMLVFAHGLFAAYGLMFVIGVTTGAFTTLNGAVMLRNTDPRYMGRVMSLAMLAFGAFGLMGLPVGKLADAVGEGTTLAILGGLVCVAVLVQGLTLARTPAPAEPERAY